MPGAMAALVEHVVTGGCTGLFVLGGCGEGAWLTTAQRDAVVRSAVKAAAGRVPVLAAVMLPATGPATEAARRARGEGADAVVVGSPYYFAVDGGGHRRHVEAVLEAAGLPGLLYNIPQCTHAVLAADTVATLARDTRVLGMKDSAGDFATFQRYLAVKRDAAGLPRAAGPGVPAGRERAPRRRRRRARSGQYRPAALRGSRARGARRRTRRGRPRSRSG